MPASYKVLGTQAANGYGYFAFTLSGVSADAALSADWHCGSITLPLEVHCASVDLPGSLEEPLYVLAYPLTGSRDESRVRVYADGKRLMRAPGVQQRGSKTMDLVRRLLHKRPAGAVPDLMQRTSNQRIDIELLGIYPLDKKRRVMRARIFIPKALCDTSWSWHVYDGVGLGKEAKVLTLLDDVDENGNRVIVISTELGRWPMPLLVTVTSGDTHYPWFFGMNRKQQWDCMFAFYALTTDAKADPAYPSWFATHRATQAQLAEQRAAKLDFEPLMSIVIPVFEPPLDFFDACIQSVIAQTYANWELILVNASPDDAEARAYLNELDDERIRVVELPENLGIAGNTNVGIEHANGDYISFVDQDDMLEPNTLFEYVSAINENPETDLLYCDEDGFEGDLTNVFEPMLKPDYNEDVLEGHNYIVHMLTVSRHALEQVELSPDYSSGAQDYDLTLKVAHIARRIAHVPQVLYHWRHHAKSTSGGVGIKPYANEAGRRAVEDFMKREGYTGEVSFGGSPAVYKTIYDAPCDISNVCVIETEDGEIDTAAVNATLASSNAEFLLFKDSSLEPNNEDYLKIMLGYFQRPDVGAVGALIVDKDELIYHAGLAFMDDGRIAHMNELHTLATNKGYLGSTECARDYSAVTSKCMLVRRSIYEEVGGFDPELEGDWASFDFCWKLRKLGYTIVYTPYATFTRHWSVRSARGVQFTRAKTHAGVRFCPGELHTANEERQRVIMRERYPELFEFGDPAINTNCSHNSPYFALGS